MNEGMRKRSMGVGMSMGMSMGNDELGGEI